jgi:hypothetical protein
VEANRNPDADDAELPDRIDESSNIAVLHRNGLTENRASAAFLASPLAPSSRLLRLDGPRALIDILATAIAIHLLPLLENLHQAVGIGVE